MGRAQRIKGKVVEREAVKYLTALGFDVRRARQHDGKVEPDLVFVDCTDLWPEIKGVKSFRPWHKQSEGWIDRAISDSANGTRAFVLAKVHGTRQWALGWRDPFGRYVWLFSSRDIALTLEGWMSC